jgi:hypothetical protein
MAIGITTDYTDQIFNPFGLVASFENSTAGLGHALAANQSVGMVPIRGIREIRG